MRSRDLHCATCRAERRFEAPPCPDGHGAECDELVCTICGCAVIDAPTAAPAGRRGPTGRVPARRRQAA